MTGSILTIYASRTGRGRRLHWIIEWSDAYRYPAWTAIWTCADVREIAPMLARMNG